MNVVFVVEMELLMERVTVKGIQLIVLEYAAVMQQLMDVEYVEVQEMFMSVDVAIYLRGIVVVI